MINTQKAFDIIRTNLPDFSVQKQVLYDKWFIFVLTPPDPEEPDIFVKVSQLTGIVLDFVPWNEPDPKAIEQALLNG